MTVMTAITRSSVRCYNRPVLKRPLTLLLAAFAFAQQEPKPEPPAGQPQVKMNYLNVCTPSAEEQAGIKGAMAAVPGKPAFIQDFEISRGLATLKDAPRSRFVRLRREFSPESPFLTAQYSISSDSTSTIETLVLRMRDPKDFYELSLQDQSSAGAASPLMMLAVDTPVARVRVERLTKSSTRTPTSRCFARPRTSWPGTAKHWGWAACFTPTLPGWAGPPRPTVRARRRPRPGSDGLNLNRR